MLGETSAEAARHASYVRGEVSLFSKSNKAFWGHLDPVNIRMLRGNLFFLGDLADVLAKPETLIGCNAATVYWLVCWV